VTAVPGKGLAKGLAVTFGAMMRRSVTKQYPDVAPELPPRSRGVIALLEENCTVCMLCARECPDWCIYIDSHKETLPAPEGGRARVRNVLDRFAIDFALCMYCGICIEACPFDALFWSPEFEYAEYDVLDLTHEADRLRDWMWTVPAPPALDPGAEPAKEVTAAEKSLTRPARPAAAERPPRVARAREAPMPARPQPGDADAVPLEPEVAQGGEADAASAIPEPPEPPRRMPEPPEPPRGMPEEPR